MKQYLYKNYIVAPVDSRLTFARVQISGKPSSEVLGPDSLSSFWLEETPVALERQAPIPPPSYFLPNRAGGRVSPLAACLYLLSGT